MALRAAISDWVRVSHFCKESWRDFLRRPLLERSCLALELVSFLDDQQAEAAED